MNNAYDSSSYVVHVWLIFETRKLFMVFDFHLFACVLKHVQQHDWIIQSHYLSIYLSIYIYIFIIYEHLLILLLMRRGKKIISSVRTRTMSNVIQKIYDSETHISVCKEAHGYYNILVTYKWWCNTCFVYRVIITRIYYGFLF